MRFIHYPPQLIGKSRYGVWRVTVLYLDGRKHEHDYIASSSVEAKRRYLMEFGTVHQGRIYAEFVKKNNY